MLPLHSVSAEFEWLIKYEFIIFGKYEQMKYFIYNKVFGNVSKCHCNKWYVYNVYIYIWLFLPFEIKSTATLIHVFNSARCILYCKLKCSLLQHVIFFISNVYNQLNLHNIPFVFIVSCCINYIYLCQSWFTYTSPSTDYVGILKC